MNNTSYLSYSDKLIFIFSFYEILRVDIPVKELKDNNIDLQLKNEFPLDHVLLINQLKQNCAYRNSFNLYNDIINHLDENSALFEHLFFLYSGYDVNLFYSDNLKMFKLSMLSLDKILKHLKKVIPNFIIRGLSNKNDNEQYILDCGFIILYEKELFHFSYDEGYEKLLKNKDEKWEYSIPIFMVLICEAFGNAKLQINKYKELSPIYIFNPYDNHYLLYQGHKEENGRLIEYCISHENKNIQYLKFSFEPLIEISDYKFWVDKDLVKLNSYLVSKMQSSNFEPKKEHELPVFPAWSLDTKGDALKENKNFLQYLESKTIKKDEFEYTKKICK